MTTLQETEGMTAPEQSGSMTGDAMLAPASESTAGTIIAPADDVMETRRRGPKVINAWKRGESWVDFSGNAQMTVDSPQGQQLVPFQFPINNCYSFEEAFGAFEEAAKLHIRVMHAQHQMTVNQQIAQHQMMQNKATIEKAVRGIELARR